MCGEEVRAPQPRLELRLARPLDTLICSAKPPWRSAGGALARSGQARKSHPIPQSQDHGRRLDQYRAKGGDARCRWISVANGGCTGDPGGLNQQEGLFLEITDNRDGTITGRIVWWDHLMTIEEHPLTMEPRTSPGRMTTHRGGCASSRHNGKAGTART